MRDEGTRDEGRAEDIEGGEQIRRGTNSKGNKFEGEQIRRGNKFDIQTAVLDR
jgi:hypothetical protein